VLFSVCEADELSATNEQSSVAAVRLDLLQVISWREASNATVTPRRRSSAASEAHELLVSGS
jgi:hypothetical protein